MFNLFSSPLSKGIKLMKQDRHFEAMNYFNDLVKKGLQLPELYFELGRCCFKLERYKESKINLHKALDRKYSRPFACDILEITNWGMLCSYNYFNNWPAFSPDSKTLAYVSVRRDTNGDGKINALDNGGIYLIDLETGKERCVVSDEYYNSQPVFSPDGKKLAYLSVRKYMQNKKIIDHRANPLLCLMDLKTEQETQLLDDSYRIKHCSFYPDSERIIFCCWRPGDKNSGVYELDIEMRKMDVLVTDSYENTFPSVSKYGNKLIFSSWRRDTNNDGLIDIRDNSGIHIKDLVTGIESVVSSDKYNNIFPSFSPDGVKAIYLSVRHDTNNDGVINSLDNPGIYIYDLVRKKERCVVDDRFFNKFPNFTSDGKQVVFISSWRQSRKEKESKDYFKNKGIYVLDIARKKIQRIVSEKYYGCRFPVVSPDGQKIAYISWRSNTNRGLYLADLYKVPSRDELHKIIDENI